jgi:hypothetical protein
MELRHLRYFVAVADAGSLTVAAEQKLNTSQPSLSRQIRDLEYEVGVPLMTDAVEKVAVFIGDRLGLTGGLDPVLAGVPACRCQFSRCRRELGSNGRAQGTERQGLEVLYDSGEMEFVTRPGQPSKPHAFKSMVDFKVSKTHLDALTFIA